MTQPFVDSTGTPQQRSERDILRALKKVLYERAPLFVKMKAQLRRDLVAELARDRAAASEETV